MSTLYLCLLASSRGPFRALKMRPVPQEAVHSLWSRLFCGPLKMRRVPEEAVFDTEYLFRTVEACFFTPNASENASRTPGSLFEHGTRIPYHRRPSPVPRTILTRSTSYINLTSITRKRIDIILIFAWLTCKIINSIKIW